jgi:hypothetical protein
MSWAVKLFDENKYQKQKSRGTVSTHKTSPRLYMIYVMPTSELRIVCIWQITLFPLVHNLFNISTNIVDFARGPLGFGLLDFIFSMKTLESLYSAMYSISL